MQSAVDRFARVLTLVAVHGLADGAVQCGQGGQAVAFDGAGLLAC